MRKRKLKRIARREALQYKMKHPEATDLEVTEHVQVKMKTRHGISLDIGAIWKILQLILELFSK